MSSVLCEDFKHSVVLLYCIALQPQGIQEVMRAAVILDDLRLIEIENPSTLLQGKMEMMRVFRVEGLLAALSATVPPPSVELVSFHRANVALRVVITVLESE